ncbi:hypothetical protein OKW28_002111 [Paraburkholderia sp. 40]
MPRKPKTAPAGPAGLTVNSKGTKETLIYLARSRQHCVARHSSLTPDRAEDPLYWPVIAVKHFPQQTAVIFGQ